MPPREEWHCCFIWVLFHSHERFVKLTEICTVTCMEALRGLVVAQ